MTAVQAMGLDIARKKLIRARKEYERALLQNTAYRGVEYTPNRPYEETHGTFVYRGRTYVK